MEGFLLASNNEISEKSFLHNQNNFFALNLDGDKYLSTKIAHLPTELSTAKYWYCTAIYTAS
jgi:hypothetical protein